MINFGTVSLKKPTKQGLLANKTVPVVLAGFGDDDDDSGDEGGDLIRRTMEANAKKNKRNEEASKNQIEMEIPGLLDYDTKDEPKKEIIKQETNNQSKFIQAMKIQAEQREAEREITNQRIISNEAKRTDHLYSDVDNEIAPIATPVFIKKSEEARKRAATDAVINAIDDSRSAAKTGFAAFNSTLLQKRAAEPTDDDDEKESEEYQDQLRNYLQKKDQQRKQERREKYQRLKEEQREQPPSEEQPAAPLQSSKEVIENNNPEPVGDSVPKTETDKPAIQTALSTAETIEKLTYVAADRKKNVLERRKERMARRNTDADIESLRDRFLKRKLESMT